MQQPDASATRQQLLRLIGGSLESLDNLLETLTSEHEALKAQDLDTLDSILGTKASQLDRLRELEVQRHSLCQRCGFDDGPEQMPALLDWCDAGAEVSARWAELLESAAECERRNMTNGAIISGRSHQIQTNISLLRGNSAGTETYNRDGRTPGGHPLRSIAEA